MAERVRPQDGMLPPLAPREGGAATPGTAQTPLSVPDPGAAAAAGLSAGATPSSASALTGERSAAATPASEGSVHGQVMPQEPIRRYRGSFLHGQLLCLVW